MMSRTRVLPAAHGWLLLTICLMACNATPAAEFDSDDWRITTPEEREMKSEPKAPGAAAVYLYTQIDRNDQFSSDHVYRQVKILTEEGRNRASVEIQYDKSQESISDIEARVVQPDGSVTSFKGTVYESPIATGRDVKLLAKTFTLPDVRVGSILDYRYKRIQRMDILYNTHWELSQDLFTRFSRYSIALYRQSSVSWNYPNGLPAGASPVLKNGTLRLELHDVPAIVTEQYMPPADELRYMVNFQYSSDDVESDQVKFWNKLGKRSYRAIDNFADDSGAVRDALAAIVQPGDSAAQKVHKIYDHVQHMRNTTYEPEVDEQEAKRRKDRDASRAKEVAKHGYGDRWELLGYFLALVRMAGVPAEPVLVGRRDEHFFNERILNGNQLEFRVVAVTLDGNELLLDPATPYLPFGELHWADTAVRARRLDEDGGKWMTTPVPKPSDALVSRKAHFTLSADGELDGTVTITYSGREALWRRIRERNDDEQARREFLVGDLKDQLAGQAEIKLLRQPEWSGRDEALQVEYNVKLPQWAVVSGSRILIGAGMFGGQEKGVFVTPQRVLAVYYSYPFQNEDEIHITAPAGYHASTPAALPVTHDGGLNYSTSVEAHDGDLVIHRSLSVAALLSPRETYGRFRGFYDNVRTGDGSQLLLVR